MDLKFCRSMTHRTAAAVHFTVAALGTKYSRASSPKLPPLIGKKNSTPKVKEVSSTMGVSHF
eukprot:4337686-Amphidinium_carterae.1